MKVYHPKSLNEAVLLRHDLENSAYLAGGTELLRLGAKPVDSIVDINNLLSDEIEERNGRLYIGARTSLETLCNNESVPGFIREAASFCFSFEKRNSATIGGNLAARRCDSYLSAALAAADAQIIVECRHGEKNKSIAEYLSKDCKALIRYIVIDKNRNGFVKRFGRTASTHATLIAAYSAGIYALSVSSSPIAIGKSKDIYKEIEYKSDLEGSAEYKKYLASIVFEEVKSGN